jgi:hypothetical protein
VLRDACRLSLWLISSDLISNLRHDDGAYASSAVVDLYSEMKRLDQCYQLGIRSSRQKTMMEEWCVRKSKNGGVDNQEFLWY